MVRDGQGRGVPGKFGFESYGKFGQPALANRIRLQTLAVSATSYTRDTGRIDLIAARRT